MLGRWSRRLVLVFGLLKVLIEMASKQHKLYF